jgi:hypothetical protein
MQKCQVCNEENIKNIKDELIQFKVQKCPVCNEVLENIKNIKDEFIQFKDINCNKCQKNFIFILCQYCNKKIFYNTIKQLPLNGLNGVNIKCPYTSCGNYFYLTICPKCKYKQKIPKIIKEGELIKCIKNCGYEYLQVRCPRKDCDDITYFSRPKNFCNSPNGILYNHKKKVIFQKISCNFCIRPIVYYSDEKEINRYYDSMKIVCPYKDCGKIFNRIICSICSEINIIEGGYYFMGHKIKCTSCKNYFGKILCPQCLKINPLSKNFFKTGTIVCSFTSCAKKSEIINCIYCRRINVFNNENEKPIPGQQIKCAYKDCEKIFNEVYCPSCEELNPFYEGDFIFGKVYECIYAFCKKKYQFFTCPECKIYSRTTDPEEGKKYVCNNCKTLLSNWGCPFCKKTIMAQKFNLKYGGMVKCPSCQEKYSFCRCYECKKLIFAKDKNILGLSVRCLSCLKFSVNVICPGCNTRISFLDRNEDMEDGEKIKCENCCKEFVYQSIPESENNIYTENLFILEGIKGEAINFGKNQVDEKYLSIENLMIKTNLYNNDDGNNHKENKIRKKNNLCILCYCNNKESVFYPCGHRCTCYKCAVLFFERYKKCPRCNEHSEAIVPKIYEQFNNADKFS